MLFHLPLLGGLVLVGLPVLLHLLMRQKPKHIRFPAFRFLQQRAKTNQRKIRIRHLLLLLLRMMLILVFCLALAALRGRNEGSVIILIDTTPSMSYLVGKSRLDEAKARANEVLDAVPSDSKVAIVDTGGETRGFGSIADARNQIEQMSQRPGGVPITTAISTAYGLFADRGSTEADASSVRRHLFVISDRTTASWEPDRVKDLKEQLGRLGDSGVQTVYLDLGVDKPVDVAITKLEVKPWSVPVDREVVVRATVTATGQDCDTEIVCRVAGQPTPERKPVRLRAGESEVIEFLNRKLPSGRYQAEATLVTADALTVSNSRFATFEVRGARKILTITDNEEYALVWKIAFQAKEDFTCDVLTPDRVANVDALKSYPAVCLLSVRQPGKLWAIVREYVDQGGHLLVIPGRDEIAAKVDYVTDDSVSILPGRMEKVVDMPPDKPAQWETLNRKHTLLAKFVTWRDHEDIGFLKFPRSARRYWRVKPSSDENVIIRFEQKSGHDPALLEKLDNRKPGSGKVLMLTTPIDYRENAEDWNNYATTAINDGFFVVLANELVGYMLGDLDLVNWNFPAGQEVVVSLPPEGRFSEYTLDAAGVGGSDTRVTRTPEDVEAGRLAIRRRDMLGNARIACGAPVKKGEPPPWQLLFSLNVSDREYQLDRVGVAAIEELFGPGSVVSVAPNKPLGNPGRQPIDPFPWIMLAFVGLLVGESIMANRFYKKKEDE